MSLCKELKIPNLGVGHGIVPDDVYTELISQIDKIKNISVSGKKLFSTNSTLAGHLEEQYVLSFEDKILNYLTSFASDYYNVFGHNTIPKDFHLKDLWLNLQKKGEYQPLHWHTGDTSFVIWISVPYKLEDEDNLKMCKKSNAKSNGRFSIVYNTMFRGIQTYRFNLDKSHEKNIIMFPNEAYHEVYPFYTTDEMRISVSGNIVKHKK